MNLGRAAFSPPAMIMERKEKKSQNIVNLGIWLFFIFHFSFFIFSFWHRMRMGREEGGYHYSLIWVGTSSEFKNQSFFTIPLERNKEAGDEP